MKIIFMATADFAVPSLEALHRSPHTVCAVVTATDKLGGRGGKELLRTEVKQYADAHEIPVLQPEKLRDEAFLAALRSFDADIFVVVAFRMLPEMVWQMPRLGTVNIHGSLLPKYRGAAPINWAIIQGETETGVSVFFLQHAIDTGNILLQAATPIGENENFGDVHSRLSHIGAETLLHALDKINAGDTEGVAQNDAAACPAPKLFAENTEIDFNKTAAEVHNFVRGLAPHPTAWTTVDGKRLKVYETAISDEISSLPTGTILSDGKKYVKIVCKNSIIEIKNVQLATKKRMPIVDFLNGYSIQTLNAQKAV